MNWFNAIIGIHWLFIGGRLFWLWVACVDSAGGLFNFVAYRNHPGSIRRV